MYISECRRVSDGRKREQDALVGLEATFRTLEVYYYELLNKILNKKYMRPKTLRSPVEISASFFDRMANNSVSYAKHDLINFLN